MSETGASTITPDQIWKGDLLDRRSEAQLLVGYIESLPDRPGPNRATHAYTIAVDAGYGKGKTFFLQRLAQHLAINHPVAFIDAWADDLADQPLVALTATLKAALAPYMSEPKVQSSWTKFANKTGRVAKIASLGLLKRGIGFLITQSATELAEDAIKGLGKEMAEAVTEKIKDASEGVSDDIFEGLRLSEDMDKQVGAFQAARCAMLDMKQSLSEVIETIKEAAVNPPVVIVVDELDRCRPSYAVKLLEEVKHLFDVPGIVFVFGMHGDQLAHSVSGAYGPQFDGKSYLRRFINRRYSLSEPNNEQLVKYLIRASGTEAARFSHPSMYKTTGSRRDGVDAVFLICLYAKIFDLSARDIYDLVDILETAIRIVQPNPIVLPYFLPLAIGHMRGLPAGEVPKWPDGLDGMFVSQSDNAEVGVTNLFAQFQRLARLSDGELGNAWNQSENDYATGLIAELTLNQQRQSELAVPRNYQRLMSAVSRFERE
jgi:hypothetical protein